MIKKLRGGIMRSETQVENTSLYLGSAWYPEHWPEERWPRDIELMVQANMNVVRIGEFAWSRLEPADGDFQFDWLERAVNIAYDSGIKVVLCTPTPTPPSWLTSAYPDILPIRDYSTGETQPHGKRGHVDPSNENYRRYSERICEELGKRFGQHPGVIGWQTDNEFWSIAANESALNAFRLWLKDEYGSLKNLNEAWSTAFWSQEYFSWEDIVPPLNYPNPSLYLAWYRFHSYLTADFQRLCIQALRQHCSPSQWITHNFHPYDEFDRTVLSQDLDIVSWDAYITGDKLSLDVAANGLDCDRLRGILRKNIWIMETLPGFVNWRHINKHLEPGETKAMAWHMIGHGADAILYWQWRSAPSCQEQYHGTLIQQDGNPRPVYKEIAEFGCELRKVEDLLVGSEPVNKVALFDRWADRQVLKKQPHHQDYIPRERVIDWYRPWSKAGYTLDVLTRVTEPLSHYAVLLAPHLHLMSDEDASLLQTYVENGGHLVLGPRTGMKDENSRLREQLQPGDLKDILGAEVREFYSQADNIPLDGRINGEAKIFCEWLSKTSEDSEVLATYGEGNGWLKGQAAVITRQHGKGRITYVGCCGNQEFNFQMQQWIAKTSKCSPVLSLPEGVEVTQRWKGDRQILLVINHSQTAHVVNLDGSYINHLANGEETKELTLEPTACAVLTPA